MTTISPNLEWLHRRWGLPSAAFAAVERLLEAERDGSTACWLEEEPPAWGHAALRVGEPGVAPLRLIPTETGLALQSHRLLELERRVARRLLTLAERTSERSPEAAIARLFPSADATDRQAAAARVAGTRHLALITGGPGTGKTYTLARVLALLVEQGTSPARIRLAAPTGKAADRMKRAIVDSLASLPDAFAPLREPLEVLAQGCTTLHSLLGHNPGSGRPRHDADNPLPLDVLIVDECSMVELRLWAAVLEALPEPARLVLLGDPNQLESVGQGDVFGELTRAAGRPESPLHAAHVHLVEARRFKERPAILELAQALEACDADACAQVLQAASGVSAERGVAWIERGGGALRMEELPASVREDLRAVAQAASPDEALERLGRICVLTAQRGEFVGAAAVSAMIEASLDREAVEGVRNQPIIINRNDPETGLRNGNLGVIHTDAQGVRQAWFPAGAGELRAFALAKLPEFSPAWAITIHRSQGSEYDDVVVILAREESPLTTRSLLYTAITRARRSVFVAGDLAAVRKAAQTPSRRVTLLGEHLRASAPQVSKPSRGEIVSQGL